MNKLFFLFFIPIFSFGQEFNNFLTPLNAINEQTQTYPGIYSLRASTMGDNLYKINGTKYYIRTKQCVRQGYDRFVKIRIWINEKNETNQEICFSSGQNGDNEYNDCYVIQSVYLELDNTNISYLSSSGKIKQPSLLLVDTYLNSFILEENSAK